MSQIDMHDRKHGVDQGISVDLPAGIDSVHVSERQVIGNCLIDPDAVDVVCEIISSDDLHKTGHSEIYATILATAASDEPYDAIVIAEKLTGSRLFKHLGGAVYLHTCIQEVYATAGTVSWHAAQIAAASRHRTMSELEVKIRQDINTGDMASLVKHSKELSDLGSGVKRSSILKPLPLDIPMSPGPFPVEVLPVSMRNMVLAVSANKQVPKDMVALFGLAAIAALAGPRLAIDQGRRKGWVEALCLYVVAALESGELKTPTGRDVFGPLHRIQKEIIAEHSEHVDFEISRLEAEGSSGILPAGCSRRQNENQINKKIEELRSSKEDGPRTISPGDTTPEKLGEWMSRNGGATAILDPEGTFFGILSGRYSNGIPNVEVSLRGYDGDYCDVGRISRTQKGIERAILTFAFGTQPSVLKEVVSNRIMMERGLMNRFIMTVPASMLGSRNPEGADYDETAMGEWEKTLRAIAEIPVPSQDTFPFPALTLAPDAGREHVRFKAWMEPRLSASGDLGDITGWASKHAGRVMRIAGLLHLAEGRGVDEAVPLETMQAAVRIGVWAIGHAVSVFGMASNELIASDTQCSDVLAWIVKKEIVRFTSRDAQRGIRTKWVKEGTADIVTDALDRLVDTRHLSVTKETDGAGRVRVVYEVNPAVSEG